MGRYCQERATQVLNDFAAVGTFLLNYDEAVSRWPGSCLSLTNGSMYRHSLFACVLRNCDECNDLLLLPTGYAWGHASYPTEVSGQVALIGKSR